MCERLALAVEPVEGIMRADAFVPDSATEPHFYAGEITELFDQTFGGMVDVEVICRLLVARSDDDNRQAQLKRYMARTGPTSIKAAIEADPTLGGACHDLHIKRVQGHRLYKVGESTYYGAEWPVRVIGTDSEG